MKYWNKQHKLREQWYKVEYPKTHLTNPVFPQFDGVISNRKFGELKRELQLLDSPGKFYMNLMYKTVYFERQQDAVYFSLRYL